VEIGGREDRSRQQIIRGIPRDRGVSGRSDGFAPKLPFDCWRGMSDGSDGYAAQLSSDCWRGVSCGSDWDTPELLYAS
jgi:hypothetical protein